MSRSSKRSSLNTGTLPPDSGAVLDLGVGAVGAGGAFGAPVALFVFVFDDVAFARGALLLGCAPRRRQRRRMRRESFGEGISHFVCPALVVADNAIGYVSHDCTRSVLVDANTWDCTAAKLPARALAIGRGPAMDGS